MNPRLFNLFPLILNDEIRNMEVEKISLSIKNKTLHMYLPQNVSDDMARSACDTVKSLYGLKSATYEIEKKKFDPEKNIIVYNPSSSHGQATDYQKNNVVLGRVDVSDMLFGRSIKGDVISLASIDETSGYVIISGRVFSVDERELTAKKTGKQLHLVTMNVTDSTNSITIKLFIKKEDDDKVFSEFYERIKDGVKDGGIYIACRGKAQYDDYAHEVVVMANDIAQIESPPKKDDNATEKRVELHLHTQMSQMDAVSSAADLINRAISWGHKAIAITDHGVVQAYPDAMKASDLNNKIKILYGVEGYLVDDSGKISYDAKDKNLDSEFVVFDIETTGLNPIDNAITEIGAVKVKNGKIIDRWSTFVNPKIPIPEEIQTLTGITDAMVEKADSIDVILPKFKEFCTGSVLVAHNAAFDMGFLKQKAKETNESFDFAYIDTLMLARCMYTDLNNHRLDTITKHLGIVLENHHRAVDDAFATAEAFVIMIQGLRYLGHYEIGELNKAFDMRSASRRSRAKHITILAQNQKGIRNLYELISQSHLRYFFRTPRLPKSLIKEKREGLVLGSACEEGELFEALREGASEEKLQEIVSFYDFLEIQPISNYGYMKGAKEFPDINTDEDLQNITRKIVELGEKYKKPVCATGDVHFMDTDGADYREILMYCKKGITERNHKAPLYFRNTAEMLKEFEFLGNDKAYEVVVTNTNLVADMIDNVRPIPKEKCSPVVEGAKEGIVNDSIKKAKKIYGDPLPDLVQKRLDKELSSITTYGFEVMYKIAQELVRKSLSDGYLVGSRGSVGSSFVAFLSGITEVNSLPAHYVCPKCKNVEFMQSDVGISGCDLKDKDCPICGTKYNKDGHDIPFETFLGFKGDKEPDIDLNFSGEYQGTIHKYTETFFGEGFVFRAGTISTVAEKTAFGYVKKFCEEKKIIMREAEKKRLAQGCVGVKRTSGQHPGGIIVVPYTNNIHEFCPIQHPADDVKSNIFTTHFDYHSIDSNLLKLDELGHDDPTVIKMLEDITGIDARSIPLDDEETLSLFTSNKALKLNGDIGTNLGSYGIPEFGTSFVRQMLVDTKPTMFSELVRISGLSHGTDVWLNNAQEFIRQGYTDLSHSICCRDDIMIYLISQGVEAGHAFRIMEMVRKGKGLKREDEEAMNAANVPQWYMESCKKIKYMFPKAHAVAYVMSAFRIAYFKVHYPEAFYATYFSVRADDFDAMIMTKGVDVARAAMAELIAKKNNGTISPKEENVIPILEICIEMYCRGFKFTNIDLYQSHATNFIITDNGIRPSLNALAGLGENVARAIMEERKNGEFRDIEDFRARTGASKTIIDLLETNGCFEGWAESEQVNLWEI